MSMETIKADALADVQGARQAHGISLAVARGIALFLGGFTLLNLLGELRARHFDANLWWIDLRPLPPVVAEPLLLLAGMALLAFGLGVLWGRRLVPWAALGLILATGANTLQYYAVLRQGVVYTGPWFPVSLWLLAAFGFILWTTVSAGDRAVPRRSGLILITLFVCLVGFPLLQIYTFGKTDYRRRADAIVVLGAKAYANGTLSTALHDRMRTAVALYKAGYAPRMIFSGGPSEGAMHETEAMRRFAMRQGVPAKAILLDMQGLDTYQTVHNTVPIFQHLRIHRVIAVSHFFHLPRIKMTYQRVGWDVYTVPAEHQALQREVPYLVVREMCALVVYYLRPLLP